MPRKTDRDFTQAFQAAGILDALAGPQISDNIQMTYQVGDLAELLNIVRFPRRYATVVELAGGAGDESVVKVVPPPDGAVLFFHIRNSNVASVVEVEIGPITALVGEAVFAGGFETQGPTRSVITNGDRPLTPAASGIFLNTETELAFANNRPIILEPGSMFTMTGPDNTGITVEIGYQEIPRAAVGS